MPAGLSEEELPISITTPEQWHQRYVEQARWTAGLRKYLFERLELYSNARILEVGCGTGALFSEMNPLNTTSITGYENSPPASSANSIYAQDPTLHGLDLDWPSLRLCTQNAPAAHLAQGDAHRLPYASASFDAVFCHFLLLWVADPFQVVKEMKRVARPSAAILALAEPDYGGRIDYPEELVQLGRWQQLALEQQGADSLIGRKLGAVFGQAGLNDIQVGVLGAEWRSPLPADSLEWQVLESDLAHMVDARHLQNLCQADEAARAKGERILFVPTFYAVGKR
jgi:SAM-dependent methyltransferase